MGLHKWVNISGDDDDCCVLHIVSIRYRCQWLCRTACFYAFWCHECTLL